MKLNLGCGEDLRTSGDGERWLNVDREEPRSVSYRRTDTEGWEHFKKWDLDLRPWPWNDDEASHAVLDNVLEHLRRPFGAVREVSRVVEPGGSVRVVVPHRESPSGHQINHRSTWDRHSLDPVIESRLGPGAENSLEDEALFRVVEQEVQHRHPWAWHQREHLGRELVAWGPQRVVWLLEVLDR